MKKRTLLYALGIFLVTIMVTGCFNERLPHAYYGPNGDLNSEVTNSILGIYCVDFNRIAVVEEDSFGRRLFAYWGQTVAANPALGNSHWIYSFLIVQKSDEEYVYYYPDYNFVLYRGEREYYKLPEEELVRRAKDPAKADDIEWLKQKNDWGEPFDESKCFNALISQQNLERASKSTLVSDGAKEKAREQIALLNSSNRGAFYYLTSDDYGRHIYFYRVIRDEDEVYTKSYVVAFNKDGSYDETDGIMEITDLWDYQDDLKAFKERNGWNTPPS